MTAELCLLSGASGFIGGHIAERLVAEGYRVRALIRPTSDTTHLKGLDVELVQGDLASPGSLAQAAAGCRYAVHCGALVSDWASVEEITQVNVAGTRSLIAAALSASVERFVHISTTDIYGHPGSAGIGETYVPSGFANWYAQTKLEAEREVRTAGESGRIEVVILRPATVFGPRSEEVVGEMASAIRRGQMLLIDHGRTIAGLTYVENLVDAAILAIGQEAARGEAFNITDGLDVTWRRFVDDLADGLGSRRVRWSLPYGAALALGFSLEHGYRFLHRAVGVTTPALLSRQAVQVLGRPQDFSNRKARERLGWVPRIDYATALRATLAWLTASAPARRGRAA